MKSKKSIKFFLVLLFLTGIASAQPDTLWSKRFGGGHLDEGSCVQQTTDGGFIITGYTFSYGEGLADVWLIKTDDSGDTLWTKTFGGDRDDKANYVQQTTDGGYILVGYTRSSGAGIFDVWLIKTDDTGEMEWSKTYGGVDSDIGIAVQQTSDGGYAILANSDSYGAGMLDIWLIRTDSLGDTLWTTTIGDTLRQAGKSFQLTSDGGYIITGHTSHPNPDEPYETHADLIADIWLVKMDALGDILWIKTFVQENDNEGLAVIETSDGSFVIAGYTWEYGWSDLLLIKTDDSGNTLWETIIQGAHVDVSHSLQETIDGGYIVFGHTTSYGVGKPADNIWLLKFDTAGDTLWTKVIGGVEDDRALFGQQTSDGGYIVTGYTVPSGTFFWDLWLIRFAPEVFSRQLAMTENPGVYPSSFALHQNYPNPFNPITTVKYDLPDQSQVDITVYDILGRHVKTLVNGNQEPGSKSIIWDATDDAGRPINSGIYLYRIKTGDFEQTRRMMLVK